MSLPKNPIPSLTEEDLQTQSETQDPVDVQEAIKEKDSSTSSSFSSSSSSSSVYPLSSSISDEEFSASVTSSPSKSPQSGSSSSSSMVSTQRSPSGQGSQKKSEGQPVNSQALPCVSPCPFCQIDAKVNELMQFLLLKYKTKELTTKEEILSMVIRKYHEYYPLIFYVASRGLLLVFGIEVREVEPNVNSYVLLPALDLTYDGMLSDIHGLPKTSLLIMVLCIILKEGSHASEEVVWQVLNYVGVFADEYHFIFGHARKLITEEFVQEGYLEYRQVPNSDPACYEFLWGPRAHEETSLMKFLMFLKNINGADPRF